MAVTLNSITFNHDPASARTSAINIRKNGDVFTPVPEWRANRNENFPAAYSINDTVGTRLAIVADLTGPPNTSVDIQAIELSPYLPHVLGSTAIKRVTFPADGQLLGERIDLPRPLLLQAGVGAHNISWRWQYRDDTIAWNEFATTTHRIYSILRMPSSPWKQRPFLSSNTQLPWADVLEWACRWAAFTYTPDQAASAITRAVYGLGGVQLAYDCSSGAPTNYSFPEFDCTSFLDRLTGGFGRGPRVNCTDCATIVSTFANILGANLWQSRMFNAVVPFQCNLLRLIGQYSFGNACGAGFFNYHEVAWEGNCTDLDQVYDACVQVLAPAPPAFSFIPFSPADIFFGWASGGSYRDLLVHPFSRLICQAQPQTRRRRRVY